MTGLGLPDGFDAFSIVKRGWGRQKSGRIQAPGRNSSLPTSSFHENRAGHRQYVRENQTRQGRINIVGFGRYRKHGRERILGNPTNPCPPLEARRLRRLDMIEDYRQHRRNRLAAR